MLQVFRRYDLHAIRHKLVGIYILNVSDVILTLLLLKTGLFIEGNFFMKNVVSNEPLSVFLKAVIPLALLYVLYKRMKEASIKQLISSNRLINLCLIFYIIVNCSHIFWSLLYFFASDLL